MDKIAEKLKNLPDCGGVYIMLDENKRIIYIGKARVLKNRVRQYFHNGSAFNDKTATMVSKIADFHYYVTKSEADALALEANLIKKHKPPYNILLKDDKHFPYIRVNLNEDFPCFTLTRKVKKDKAKYFGPYMGGVSVRDLLDIISSAFGIRQCKLNFDRIPKSHRPCLNYQINRCSAPCCKYISSADYKKKIREACEFLSGKDNFVKSELTRKMLLASEAEQFEVAVALRDRLRMVEKIKSGMRLPLLNSGINADVFAYFTDGKYGAVSMLALREGRMEGVQNFSVSDAGLSRQDTVVSFLTQYYSGAVGAPDEVICVETEGSESSLSEYLTQLFGVKVEVRTPKKGVKYKLTEMAAQNAEEFVKKYLENIKHKEQLTSGAIDMLASALNLKILPVKMECYDISHISGIDTVASMTVFVGGVKQPSLYRRFKIKTVDGNDDFASMREVITRRLLKAKEDSKDISFSILPDLIVIDGGKGQLSSAVSILEEMNMDIQIISLAKREEEIYLPYRSDPIILGRSTLAVRLLQRIRDEAHRFAITYNRKLREKRIKSTLEDIEGLGKKRITALVKKFGSVESIKKASLEELSQTEGISDGIAKNIVDYFAENK